jgi:release factor glutamine methyltransferase
VQVDESEERRGEDKAMIEAAMRDGHVRFLGIELLVAHGALVPRAETELLAKTAIDVLKAAASPSLRVIDMCCGAGNLACAVAHSLPNAHVWAADLTEPCVDLTRRNAAHVGVAPRVSVHRSDLFGALVGLALEGSVDLVVCNPPYISEKRLHEDRAALLELEPEEAFAAGPYGLSIHQRVIRDAADYLRPGGTLCIEIGVGQAKQVELLFKRTRSYDDIRAHTDSAGELRVVTGRRHIANSN